MTTHHQVMAPTVADARARPATVASAVSIGTVSVLSLAAGVVSFAPLGGQFAAVVVVAGLLVGVPYGAIDHLVPGHHGRGSTLLNTSLVLGYIGLAGAVWLVWQALPAAALLAFLALSCAHFGTGELAFAAVRAGRRAERRTGRRTGRTSLGVVALGSTVVLLPIAAHRDEVAPYLSVLVPGWDGRLDELLARATVIAVLALCAGWITTLLRDDHHLEAVECVVLATSALLAPPAVSLAVYFGAWHSVRHLVIMIVDDPANGPALDRGLLAPALRRLALQASIPTAAALAVLGVLWWSAGGDIHDFVAHDVALLAALTVPHAAIVWWSDRARARRVSTSQLPR